MAVLWAPTWRLSVAVGRPRAGAAAPQMLGAAYLDQRPAASGPMWDRAGAFQRLDAALTAGDAAALATEIPPSYAAFGDIAVVQGEGGLALGVVIGTHIEVRAPGGRAVLPLTDAMRAFRV